MGSTNIGSRGVVLSPNVNFTGSLGCGLRVVESLSGLITIKCPILLKASGGQVVKAVLSLPMRREARKAKTAIYCNVRGKYRVVHVRSMGRVDQVTGVVSTLVKGNRCGKWGLYGPGKIL